MDETVAFDDLLTERMAPRCRLCERAMTVVHLHIRAIGPLQIAAAVCRPCTRADEELTRLDALLHQRYALAIPAGGVDATPAAGCH